MRRFELREGTSSKFWQIGTNGQAQVKTFPTEAKAKAEPAGVARVCSKSRIQKGKGAPAAPPWRWDGWNQWTVRGNGGVQSTTVSPTVAAARNW
jgi:hypothetical protein